VVGVRVGHDHGQERLAEPVEGRAHLLGGGDLQQPVNSDYAGRDFDQVGVDECAFRLDGEAMDDGFSRHVVPFVFESEVFV
jgi:hypothetical protein